MAKINWIVKNIIWGAVFVIGLVLALNMALKLITEHNKEIEVPDMTNLSFAEASEMASKAGIKVEIGDSVYVRKVRRGVVFAQNPKAGSMVKKGRCILLTTNAVCAKKVTVPSLVGISMRQAKAELNSRGLYLGRLLYVRDIATNNVIRQLYRNSEIAPGSEVESGSAIDLVVGLSDDDFQTYMPDVKGLRYRRAVDVVRDNSLNIARLVFDKSVTNYSDSLNASVYKQIPDADGQALRMGAEVSLYLTTDVSKLL